MTHPAELEFEWGPTSTHEPREDWVRVRNAWLVIQIWRDVPMIRERPREMSIFERFILEAAVKLRRLAIKDLVKITRLPSRFLHRLAARMTQHGLLVADVSSPCWVPVLERVAAVLATNHIPVEVEQKVTFAFLPRSGDLLAMDGGDAQDLLWIQRNLAPRPAPTPPELLEHRIGDILEAGFKDCDIRLPLDFRRIVIPNPLLDEPISPTSSAYRCFGTLVRSPDDLCIHLTVVGRRRQKKSDTTEIQRQLTLRGAVKLANQWLQIETALEDDIVATRAMLSLAQARPSGLVSANRDTESGRWTLRLDSEFASVVAESRLLTSPLFDLDVTDSEGATITLSVCLAPEDPTRDWVFAVDRVIARLLEHSRPFDAALLDRLIRDVVREFNLDALRRGQVTRDRIMARLWRFRVYEAVYSIRSATDFCYERDS